MNVKRRVTVDRKESRHYLSTAGNKEHTHFVFFVENVELETDTGVRLPFAEETMKMKGDEEASGFWMRFDDASSLDQFELGSTYNLELTPAE